VIERERARFGDGWISDKKQHLGGKERDNTYTKYPGVAPAPHDAFSEAEGKVAHSRQTDGGGSRRPRPPKKPGGGGFHHSKNKGLSSDKRTKPRQSGVGGKTGFLKKPRNHRRKNLRENLKVAHTKRKLRSTKRNEKQGSE